MKSGNYTFPSLELLEGHEDVCLPDSVGIEVANDHQSVVPLKVLLADDAFIGSKAELPVAMGIDIFNKVKLLKHYLAVMPDASDGQEEMDNAIVKQPKQAEEILQSLCIEMDERNQLISQADVRNIKEYNRKYRDSLLRPEDGHHFLPYIEVVIDEYADLTIPWGMGIKSKMSSNIMASIIRLAQKGRAVGIHVIIATQRPSDDVITGLIKANFPTRIAFRVSTRTDSITILNSPGAEHLIGKGDMLYSVGKEMERMQCAYITLDEISRIVDFIAAQSESAEGPYILPKPHDEASEDAKKASIPVTEFDHLFEEVAEYVVKRAEVSVSDLQRKFAVGYCRGCRIMEQLESVGIVTSENPNDKYSVLVKGKRELAKILSGINSQ